MAKSSITRLALFILVALCAIGAGMAPFQEDTLRRLVIYLIYPCLFISFLLFGLSLIDLHRKQFPLTRLLPDNLTAWITIGAVCGILLLYEPFDFKVLNDELILSTTAELMHFDRISALPGGGNDLSGSYQFVYTTLDKRPFVFPFLISAVHDLTGYRYENVFILNAVLTIILVCLIYSVSRLLSGHRAGILSVLLAGTLPLLGTFATSGHFEILNLVGICSILALAYVYVRKPTEVSLVPLVLGLIIFFQIRYENPLYLFPFGILILLGWKKSGRIILPWQVIVSSVFLILYLIHYRLILGFSDNAFQHGPDGREKTFSLSYLKGNLTSAGEYLFSIGQSNSNSYLLTVFGITSLFMFCMYALKKHRTLTGMNSRGTIMLLLVMAVFLYSLIIMTFNYGLFDIYITNRLSLPIQLLFILLVPFILLRYKNIFLYSSMFFVLICGVFAFQLMTANDIIGTGIQYGVAIIISVSALFGLTKLDNRKLAAFCWIPAIYILAISIPIGHAHHWLQKYKSNKALTHEIGFLKEKEGEKIFWVTSSPFMGLMTRTNTEPLSNFGRSYNEIWQRYQNGDCTGIYIPRLFELQKDGGFKPLREEDYVNEEFLHLETVLEKPVKTGVIYRVEQLTDIGLGPNRSTPDKIPTDFKE